MNKLLFGAIIIIVITIIIYIVYYFFYKKVNINNINSNIIDEEIPITINFDSMFNDPTPGFGNQLIFNKNTISKDNI